MARWRDGEECILRATYNGFNDAAFEEEDDERGKERREGRGEGRRGEEEFVCVRNGLDMYRHRHRHRNQPTATAHINTTPLPLYFWWQKCGPFCPPPSHSYPWKVQCNLEHIGQFIAMTTSWTNRRPGDKKPYASLPAPCGQGSAPSPASGSRPAGPSP